MATCYYFPTFLRLSSDKIFFSNQIFSQDLCIFQHRHKNCYSRFLASSSKKSSKKVKSNEDLCSEIREFLSTVGYPEDHVPSMKELAQHGRKDLAHMVRRRGYKLIRQILQSSATTNLIKSDIEMDETGKLKMLGGSGGQNEKLKASVGDVLPRDVMEEGDLYRYQEKVGDLFSSDQRSVASDSSIPFMQEKVANFINRGKLVGIDEEIHAGEGERGTESEDAHEVQNTSSNQGNNNLLYQSSIGGETLNINSTNSYVSKEEQTPVNHKNDLDDEEMKAENLAEVNRLKVMLHQKELELDQLKKQIEKEKAYLSTLQNNAEIEINRAQKLISEKETELYAAEGSLSGLKEVEVKYTGYGEIVELAGSFNGWHHRIKMDPHSSSIGVGPTETRKSLLWRTVLWLYPGIYEIKFVVDGDWRIDPSMESVTRDTLHNNIIKVVTAQIPFHLLTYTFSSTEYKFDGSLI
ncbi:protein PTST homolog 3, chloroplastic-like isoform X2 [Primulina eburnea]|uniref:protein PTST homolog 3, chloroplastic-like isoform X2 n=1 Tax=Primulina eburnea TaxID=1245227 RepID=UPI003C6CBC5A